MPLNKEDVLEYYKYMQSENRNLLKELHLRDSFRRHAIFNCLYFVALLVCIYIKANIYLFILISVFAPFLISMLIKKWSKIGKYEKIRTSHTRPDGYQLAAKGIVKYRTLIAKMGYGEGFERNDALKEWSSDKVLNELTNKPLKYLNNQHNVLRWLILSNARQMEKVIKDYQNETGDNLIGMDSYNYEIEKEYKKAFLKDNK